MNVKALDNDGVLSIFVEAYLQEVGISDEADPSIRNRNVTAILLALFGWSVGDHPGCGFTGCSDVDELYCSECADTWACGTTRDSFSPFPMWV